MKTVIIDNDVAAINHLEYILEEIDLTTIVSKHTCPLKAEKEIIKIRPDLIILESNFKEIDGLTLAKKIEKEFADIKIIFVTSHQNIKIEAFELNQVDFIFKPLEKQRINQVLKKFTSNFLMKNQETIPLISCFKNFKYIELQENDRINQIDLNWRTKHAKEIFAYLITHKKINVRKDVLIEMFWPEIPLKEAYHNLYTNIYFIRNTLKKSGIAILINNNADSYTLNLKNVKTDFEFLVEKIEKYKDVDIAKLEKAMDLYQGHFLEEENYLWADYKMQKYRLIWLETMEYIIETHRKENNIHRAIINALALQNIDPYLEQTYYILMELFSELRDFSSIKNQYKRLEEMLKEEYNIKPENNLKYYLK